MTPPPSDLPSLLHDLLSFQFDLEILLKKRERDLLRLELAKGEIHLAEMANLILNDQYPLLQLENDDIPSSDAASYSRPSNLRQNIRHKLVRIPSGSSISDTLYARRDDGVYVKLQCPKCQRTNFSNQQGFINHCRISHGLEFVSHEESNWICGIPVPESQVPLNHPARRKHVSEAVLSSLQTKLSTPDSDDIFSTLTHKIQAKIDAIHKELATSSPQEEFSRSKIKVYEEEVDLFDESERPAKRLRAQIPPLENTLELEPPSSNVYANELEDDSDEIQEENNGFELEDLCFKRGLGKGKGVSGRSIMSGSIGAGDMEQNSNYPLSQSHSPLLETPTQDVNGVLDITAGVINARPRSRPLYHTDFDAKPLVNDIESRFHHKRRIVIGNVSKFIPKDKRAPGLSKASHKWMIYVRAPPWSTPLTTFISKIRFFIHHSYAPNHIIDITSPPFRLIRHGWGEFPIRVQIHLIDRSKNKPVNFIHLLQLDQTHSGRQVLGAEEEFDIELDKNTDLSLVAGNPESKSDDSVRSQIVSRKPASLVEQFSRILHEIIDQFPLISDDVDITAQSLPYPIHSSTHAFLSLSQDEQETIEDKRAQFIIAHLRNQNIDLPAEASVEYVKIWCRENGHTPQDVISKPLRIPAGFDFSASVPANTLLCKSCGRQACAKRLQKRGCPFFVLSCFSNHVSSFNKLNLNMKSDAVADLQIDDLTSNSSSISLSSSKTRAFGPDNTLPYTLLSLPSFAFIMQAISQLNLSCFLPSSTPSADTQSNVHKKSDIVLTRRNRLSYASPPSGHLWSGQNGHEEEVLGVITLAMGRFLKQIVEKSIQICRNEHISPKSERANGNHSVLTPMHVWKAIAGGNGSSTLRKDGKAVSLHDCDEIQTNVEGDAFDFLRGLYCVNDHVKTDITQSSIDNLANKNSMD